VVGVVKNILIRIATGLDVGRGSYGKKSDFDGR
jgi:hypothetical protein